MDAERTCPRMLPIMDCDGRSWFVDERLGQFREVWNPHHWVDFESDQGWRMLVIFVRQRREAAEQGNSEGDPSSEA